jgi:hypothetical protein
MKLFLNFKKYLYISTDSLPLLFVFIFRNSSPLQNNCLDCEESHQVHFSPIACTLYISCAYSNDGNQFITWKHF